MACYLSVEEFFCSSILIEFVQDVFSNCSFPYLLFIYSDKISCSILVLGKKKKKCLWFAFLFFFFKKKKAQFLLFIQDKSE